jgi:hypothetical protein
MTTSILEAPLHVPAPGSRMAHATQDDMAMPATMDEFPPVEKEFIVRTREQRAAHSTYRTVVLAANASQRLLSRNDLRRSAVISCVAGTVVLCNSSAMAAAVEQQALSTTPTAYVYGYYMPAGTAGSAVPITGIEGVYGVATTSGAAVVSIIEESWEQE